MSGAGEAQTSGSDETSALLSQCRAKPHLYNQREVEFLRSVATQLARPARTVLTAKQLEWLRALAEREDINFDKVNRNAIAVLQTLLARWLPDGKVQGKEYVACNPMRADNKPGSFRINIHNGKWSDFATKDSGGDPVSLAAYLFHSGDQWAAARDLKRAVGA